MTRGSRKQIGSSPRAVKPSFQAIVMFSVKGRGFRSWEREDDSSLQSKHYLKNVVNIMKKLSFLFKFANFKLIYEFLHMSEECYQFSPAFLLRCLEKDRDRRIFLQVQAADYRW